MSDAPTFYEAGKDVARLETITTEMKRDISDLLNAMFGDGRDNIGVQKTTDVLTKILLGDKTPQNPGLVSTVKTLQAEVLRLKKIVSDLTCDQFEDAQEENPKQEVPKRPK